MSSFASKLFQPLQENCCAAPATRNDGVLVIKYYIGIWNSEKERECWQFQSEWVKNECFQDNKRKEDGTENEENGRSCLHNFPKRRIKQGRQKNMATE